MKYIFFSSSDVVNFHVFPPWRHDAMHKERSSLEKEKVATTGNWSDQLLGQHLITHTLWAWVYPMVYHRKMVI